MRKRLSFYIGLEASVIKKLDHMASLSLRCASDTVPTYTLYHLPYTIMATPAPQLETSPADGWCPECDMYMVVLPNICDSCQQKRDYACTCDGGPPCPGCARYLADQAEYDIWCGMDEPQCECDGSGRMCDFCAEEYAEPCRGCGVSSHLWTDNTYCRKCYVERHGDEFPKTVRVSDELKAELLANLPTEGDKWRFTPAPSDAPPLPMKTLESMRMEILEIEARLKTNMTKAQKDDWIWLLQNRRADLADAEKEMWAGYDQDDLRKLDLQSRR